MSENFVSYEKIIDTLDSLFPGIEMEVREGHTILQTVCHHADPTQGSNKLYLYENPESRPIFQCYTGCGDAFDIHELLRRHYKLLGEEVDFKKSLEVIYGKGYQSNWKPENKNFEDKRTEEIARVLKRGLGQDSLDTELEVYDSSILRLYSEGHLNPWLVEGFDLETLKEWNIGYSLYRDTVSIPHYNRYGDLIGVRGRFFKEKDLEYGKYRPLYHKGQLYNHSLALNLFGIHRNQETIAETKSLILFEGEKSVIMYDQFSAYNNSLAVCGSSISNWQEQFIVKYLNPKVVIIAFDKEYSNHEEWFQYKERIAKQVQYLKSFSKVYLMRDVEGRFALKESPVDRTISDFKSMEFVEL